MNSCTIEIKVILDIGILQNQDRRMLYCCYRGEI